MSRLKDALSNVPATKAVEIAFCAIDGIQGQPPAAQVAGIFLLASVVAQQLGLNVSDLFNQSQRRYDFADTYYKREAQALTDYVNGELR